MRPFAQRAAHQDTRLVGWIAEDLPGTHAIIVNVGEKHVGCRVDSVTEVLRIRGDEIQIAIMFDVNKQSGCESSFGVEFVRLFFNHEASCLGFTIELVC